MTDMTRRDILIAAAGLPLLAACGNGTVSALSSPPPSVSGGARPVDLLDRLVKRYCAKSPFATAALFVNGATMLRGYAAGVPSNSVDTSWIFGIGSNTKVFTSVILARECGGANPTRALTDRVTKYLPPAVGRNGHAIRDVTLVDLATHTASFPHSVRAQKVNTLFFDEPPNAAQIGWWTDWRNDGTPHNHDECAGKTPGTCYSYSDWGFITLGFAVAGDWNSVAGNKYTDVLSRLVTKPLGLKNTGAHNKLSVPGHNADGSQTKFLPTDLRSNAVDILRFLEACLGKLNGVPADMQAALDLTQQVHWDGSKYGNPKTNVGLAWQLPVVAGKPQLVWKNGEAGGFTSFMGMIPSQSLAVAILTNSDAAKPTSAGIRFLRGLSD